MSIRLTTEHDQGGDITTLIRGTDFDGNGVAFSGNIGGIDSTVFTKPVATDRTLVLRNESETAIVVTVKDSGDVALQETRVNPGDVVLPLALQGVTIELFNPEPAAAPVELFIY